MRAAGHLAVPARWTRSEHVRRRAEIVYAVVLLTALTQGPVLSVWLRQSSPTPTNTDLAIQTTYLAVQVPALALLARRGLARGASRAAIASIVVFAGLMLVSSTWATVRGHTFPAAVALAATTGVGLYLASAFDLRRLVAVVFVGMQPGLLASAWALARDWPGARNTPADDWIGIYFNRNSLGPPAVVGAMAGVVLLFDLARRRPARWPAAATGIAAVVVFDLLLQRGADSLTSWVALAAFAGTWAVAMVGRAWLRRRHVRLWRRVGLAHLGLLTAGWSLALAAEQWVSRALGRPGGFDDRTLYWEANWHGVTTHPLRGYGWLGAWYTPDFRARIDQLIAYDVWSHSAYFDVALGAGIIGVAVFAAALLTGFAAAGRSLDRDDAFGPWPLALASAVALAATQESFVIGNHFYYALLVASFSCRLGLARRPDTVAACGTADAPSVARAIP